MLLAPRSSLARWLSGAPAVAPRRFASAHHTSVAAVPLLRHRAPYRRATSAATASVCGLTALATCQTVARADAARGMATLAMAGKLPAGVEEVTLYQYEICPYCCKVKAYLDWAQIPYRVVEINPVAKKEMAPLKAIPGGETAKKVPVLVLQKTDGSQELLIESSDIIDYLSAAMGNAPVGAPEEQAQWRAWVNDYWVRVVTVNIYRNVGESLQTFEYMTSLGKFSAIEKLYVRYGGGLLMWGVAKGMRSKYKMADGKDGNGKEPREPLFAAVDAWTVAVAGGTERLFMGGESPSIADIEVFGVLQAIRGMDAFVEMQDHSPALAAWYQRMVKACPSARLPNEDGVPYTDPRA